MRDSASRSGWISARMRAVGFIPWPARWNSGSPYFCRSLASAVLTGGLAHAEMLRGGRDAAVFVDGHQHRQQVEIEVAGHGILLLQRITDIQFYAIEDTPASCLPSRA